MGGAALQLDDAYVQGAHGRMLHTERTFAPQQCALQMDERLTQIAASRTRLAKLLERDHDGHVIRREHLLANPQRVPVQSLRASMITDSSLRDGETGEHCGDVGMTIALGARYLEQAPEHRLRAREVRLSDVQPAQFVECHTERRML